MQILLLIAACADPGAVRSPGTSTGDTGALPTGPTGTPTGSTPDCPDGPGSACDPFPIAAFPTVDAQDTLDSPYSRVDAYGCAPDTDESGPEWWYAVTVTEPGVLIASIDERPADGVDVDLHLLGSTDPGECLARDHQALAVAVEPGTVLLVIDTWVDADGVPQAGPYTLTVDLVPTASGDCATVPTDLQMFWTSCDPGVPGCFESGGSVFLSTPTTGPVVKEAHLVTTADGFGSSWPGSFTDGIADHYAMSQSVTGYVMDRAEPWAPAGEGGSEYGQGATGAPLPPDAEAFYVNMYWRQRPAAGTRMIVRNPANGRAVVAAAGYETGPGANDAIGGVTEEVHDWLGTGHRDVLELGFAVDQTLPYGPITCP